MIRPRRQNQSRSRYRSLRRDRDHRDADRRVRVHARRRTPASPCATPVSRGIRKNRSLRSWRSMRRDWHGWSMPQARHSSAICSAWD